MIDQRLGVNVDHVATLRNARGEHYPDPLLAAQIALRHGADSITIHLREDRRHIRDVDVTRIRALIDAPLNFEMAATEEMVAIALQTRPHACCIVPEKRTEVTTEGGLDVIGHRAHLAPIVARLRDSGIRVSLFVDPDLAQLQASAEIGAAVVELHTGAYAHGEPAALPALTAAATQAAALGLEVHAGHGLDYASAEEIAALPQIVELNIGHFLIGESIFGGLPETVSFMRAAMARGRASIKS